MATLVKMLSKTDVLDAAPQEQNTITDTDDSYGRGFLGMAILSS